MSMNIEDYVKSKLPEFAVDHVKTVVDKALWLCTFHLEANIYVVAIAAWLHDIAQERFDETYYAVPEQHHIDSAKLAYTYLQTNGYSDSFIDKVLTCIIEHRTRRGPNPSTIESLIVASADKLAHPIAYDELVSRYGMDSTTAKLKRDLALEWFLPQARVEFLRILNMKGLWWLTDQHVKEAVE